MDHHCEAITETYRQLASLNGHKAASHSRFEMVRDETRDRHLFHRLLLVLVRFSSVPSDSGKIGDAFLDLRYAWAPLHCEKANVTGLGDSWRFHIYVTAVQLEIIRTCYMCRIRDAYWSRTSESWIIRWEPIVNTSLKIMKGHAYFNIRDRKTLHRDWSAICSRLRRTIWESIIARGDINMILHDIAWYALICYDNYVVFRLIFGFVWKLCWIVIADSKEESERQSSKSNKPINSIFTKCRWNPRLVRGLSAIDPRLFNRY